VPRLKSRKPPSHKIPNSKHQILNNFRITECQMSQTHRLLRYPVL
jgi:hypothetical protein